MAEKIIETNPYVRTPKDRINRITHSALASVRINQLPISEKEVRMMASNAVRRHQDSEGTGSEDKA